MMSLLGGIGVIIGVHFTEISRVFAPSGPMASTVTACQGGQQGPRQRLCFGARFRRQGNTAPRNAKAAISVSNCLDNPGIAADRRAAVAVAPPSLVLDVEDRADRDDADAERVASTSATVGEVLADHERLPNIERAVRCRTEGSRSASAARSARSRSMSTGVSSA